MNRRRFIASGAALFAYPAFARALRTSSLRDAYTLWYNRPSAISLQEGFGIGFITSAGSIEIAQFDNELKEMGRYSVFGFNGASDHGSPALLRIPTGQYQGHIIACFSNHSSELYMCRSSAADSLSKWESVKSLDEGRCTYVSLGTLQDGTIVLMYTLQHTSGRYERDQWRETVYMMSQDGGDSWSRAQSLLKFGAGTFPYSTPFSLSLDGHLTTAYALYNYDQKRHMGLSVAIADINTGRIVTKPIINASESQEVIPYEAAWHGDSIYLTFSRLTKSTAIGYTARFDISKGTAAISSIGPIAVRGYASGAALTPDRRTVIYSRPQGGIYQKHLETGRVRTLAKHGHYSMPFTLSGNDRTLLTVSEDSIIENTRSFSANLRLMYV